MGEVDEVSKKKVTLKNHSPKKTEEGESLLYIASSKGDIKTVQEFLESSSININRVCGNNKRTALHVACLNQHNEVVKLLLEKEELKIGVLDEEGKTALERAIEVKNKEAKERLLIKVQERCGVLEENYDELALHKAVEKQEKDVVQLLLQTKPFFIDFQNEDRETALHIACMKRNVGIVRMLLKSGASVHLKNEQGRTALHIACRRGDPEIVKDLLLFGANVNSLDEKGESPLFQVHIQQSKEIITILCQVPSININQKNNAGETIYDRAIRDQVKQEMMIWMNQKKIEFYRRKYGEIAFHHALENGENKILSELRSQKEDHFLQDEKGYTSLHSACAGGNIDFVKELAKQGHLEKVWHISDCKGEEALYIACKKGREEIVNFLVWERGIDIRWGTTYLETTILHSACEGGLTKFVDFLCKKYKDQNLNRQNRYQKTALHIACQKGYVEIVRILLQRGIDINSEDYKGYLAVDYACMEGHLEILKQLKKEKNCRKSIREFHLACLSGEEKIVEFFLKEGVVNINALESIEPFDREKLTALHIACQKNHLMIVKRLWKEGARFDIKSSQNQETAIHLSIGNEEVLDFILEIEGQNINEENIKGQTAFVKACQVGCEKTVERLLREEKVYIYDMDGYERTPLHIAVKYSHKEVVKNLLEYYKLEWINGFDGYGETALHLACREKSVEIVNLLLNAGADINLKNNKGQTVLHIACRHLNLLTVQLLLKKGIDENVKDQLGETAFDHICLIYERSQERMHFSFLEKDRNLYLKIIEVFINGMKITKESDNVNLLHRLCELGCTELFKKISFRVNINALNLKGETVLHRSCLYGQFKIVEILIKNKVNLNQVSLENKTALGIAVQKGEREIVELLIKNGAFLGEEEKKEGCLLYRAVCLGWKELVPLLLEKGFSIETEGQKEKSALNKAIQYEYWRVVIQLIQGGAKLDQENIQEGEPLLHKMVRLEKKELVQLLLEKGVDINQKNKNNETVLSLAIQSEDWEIVELLVRRGIDWDQEDDSGDRLLHQMVRKEKWKIIEILKDKGVNLNQKNKNKETALSIAIENHSWEMVEFLIQEGVSLEQDDKDGISLLEKLIAMNRSDMVFFWAREEGKKQGKERNFKRNQEMCLKIAIQEKSWKVVLSLIKENTEIRIDIDKCLREAIKDGKTEVIEQLEKRGINLDAKGENGNTALHMAVECGQLKVIEQLIRKKVQLSQLNKEGQCVLEIAPSMEVMDRLVDAYIQVGQSLELIGELKKLGTKKLKQICQFEGRSKTPLLHRLARKNCLESMQLLQSINKEKSITRDFKGRTALYIAGEQKNEKMLRYLEQSGQGIKEELEAFQSSSLHLASSWGDSEVVEFLCNKSQVSLTDKDEKGRTPLYCSAEKGEIDVMCFLIKKMSEEEGKEVYKEAIDLAIQKKDERVIHNLICKEVLQRISFLREEVESFLEKAIRGGDLNIFIFILRVYKEKKELEEPLIKKWAELSVQEKSYEILNYLIAHVKYSNYFSFVVENQTDIFKISCQKRWKNIVQFYLDAERQPYWKIKLELIEASQNGSKKIVKRLLAEAEKNEEKKEFEELKKDLLEYAIGDNHIDVVKFLVKQGVNVNQISRVGYYYPLTKACLKKSVEVVEILIKAQADVNKIDSDRGSALVYACQKSNNEKIVRLLVEAQADVNQENELKVYPLLSSTCNNDRSIVRFLLSKGANPDLTDDPHLNVFRKSWELGYLGITEELLKNGAKFSVNLEKKKDSYLIEACRQGYKKIVHEFIKRNPQKVHDYRDINNRSLLDIASLNGRSEVVQVLLQEKVCSGLEEKDKSSLLYAVLFEGYLGVADQLWDDLGKSWGNITEEKQSNLLIVACMYGHYRTVRNILAQSFRDKMWMKKGNMKDQLYLYMSRIKIACKKGFKDIALLLMNQGIRCFQKIEGKMTFWDKSKIKDWIFEEMEYKFKDRSMITLILTLYSQEELRILLKEFIDKQKEKISIEDILNCLEEQVGENYRFLLNDRNECKKEEEEKYKGIEIELLSLSIFMEGLFMRKEYQLKLPEMIESGVSEGDEEPEEMELDLKTPYDVYEFIKKTYYKKSGRSESMGESEFPRPHFRYVFFKGKEYFEKTLSGFKESEEKAVISFLCDKVQKNQRFYQFRIQLMSVEELKMALYDGEERFLKCQDAKRAWLNSLGVQQVNFENLTASEFINILNYAYRQDIIDRIAFEHLQKYRTTEDYMEGNEIHYRNLIYLLATQMGYNILPKREQKLYDGEVKYAKYLFSPMSIEKLFEEHYKLKELLLKYMVPFFNMNVSESDILATTGSQNSMVYLGSLRLFLNQLTEERKEEEENDDKLVMSVSKFLKIVTNEEKSPLFHMSSLIKTELLPPLCENRWAQSA